MGPVAIAQIILGVTIGAAGGGLLGYLRRGTSSTGPAKVTSMQGVLYGAVVGGMLAIIAGPLNTPDVQASQHTLHVHSDAEFQAAVLDANQPVLVDFYASWCGPCKHLAPTIETLAEAYAGRAVIAKVDVDKLPNLASTYGVRSIPTVIVFKDGKEVNRSVGMESERNYRSQIDTLL